MPRNELERNLSISVIQEIFDVIGTPGEAFVFTGPAAYYPNGISEVSVLKANNTWDELPPSKWVITAGGIGISMLPGERALGTKLKVIYHSGGVW
jgi:hypothetical protein